MNAREASAPARSGLVPGLYALAAAVLALALTGGVLALRLMESQGPGGGVPEGATGIVGKEMRTSFGSLVVETSQRTTGLGARALAGMTHGVQNLVTPESALQQTSVVISNDGNAPLAYSPAQFSVLLGDGTRIPVQSSNVHAGALRPHSAVELKLGFVVPRKGETLRVQFADRGGQAVTVDLGSADVATAKQLQHAHH